MTKSLPGRPDLGQLKKQAKELLAGVRGGRAEALARCGGESAADFALSDAQRVLAREYGFPSWGKLKLHVETRTEETAEARLIDAALAGDRDAVREILAERPALASRSIHAAAALGDEASVAAWLARDASVASAPGGGRGWAPLLFLCFARCGAADDERARVARLLLEAGADVAAHWTDPGWPDSPQSALYGATGVNNYPKLARVLLEAGAKTQDGESCYHAAEYFHRESLEMLAEFGADFSARQEPWGNTPLYFLLGGFNTAPSVRAGIRWLLEHGANANIACAPLGETALHHAARNGWDAEIVALLLEHGADPAARRNDGRTPLALAVRAGALAAAKAMREAGAPDDVPPVDRFLGACLRADEAEARGWLERNPELLRTLTRDEALIVHKAATQPKADALRLMRRLGFDLAVAGDEGATALHVAAWHGRADAVDVLIQAGAQVDAVDGRFHAPPIGWCAHGSQYGNVADGDHASVAVLLLGADAKVPKGIEASPAVMAVLRAGGIR